ncbi:hypothetical protein [Nitrogeniibacter aestuarii]|uniref:hypothetical protein n=1 Tax=Nitrogeniibacter aestuarii TaxID=2815343 RepID=UPI001D12BC5F|nr:hypothetical protein [Nitrogeniibacter aestuarii]
MSYVVQIWADPVPASLTEASQLIDRLSTERCAQLPEFIELAKRLTEKYPCLTTPDAPGEHGAWSDGPLDGLTDEPIYGLGVSSDMIDEVMPFVVATARQLKLTVYDMQAGLAFLPDGTILCDRPNTVVAATSDADPMAEGGIDERFRSRPHFAEVFRAELCELMRSHGYKDYKSFSMFKRRTDLFDEEVQISAGSSYDPTLIWRLTPRLPEALKSEIEAAGLLEVGYTLDLWVLTNAVPFDRTVASKTESAYRGSFSHEVFWRVQSVPQAREVVAKCMGPTFEHRILPVLSKFTSWQAVDQMVNRDDHQPSPIRATGDILVLAWLAGRTDLRSLAEHLKRTTKGFKTTKIDTYLAVLERIPR